jgi:hypothetical protein
VQADHPVHSVADTQKGTIEEVQGQCETVCQTAPFSDDGEDVEPGSKRSAEVQVAARQTVCHLSLLLCDPLRIIRSLLLCGSWSQRFTREA